MLFVGSHENAYSPRLSQFQSHGQLDCVQGS